jgi:DNA-binding MarR family transcriptional regulator
MSEQDRSGTLTGSETEITLGLLEAVHENSAMTQRTVAGQLGIALGLANAYLKRCVKKGLIKVKQVPPNRYAYYLTPKGFTEKSRLTAEYLSSSFNFFRRARRECGEILERCIARGWRRIALCGTSELGEIAVLCARERDIALIGFIALNSSDTAERFAGLELIQPMTEIEPLDAVIVTDLSNPQVTFEKLRGVVAEERIFTPRLLRVVREDESALSSGGHR